MMSIESARTSDVERTYPSHVYVGAGFRAVVRFVAVSGVGYRTCRLATSILHHRVLVRLVARGCDLMNGISDIP